MPLYDYRCTECGNEIEVMHAIDGDGPATCDVCGGAMRKALSPPAIHFRGSGWAKKDARAASKSSSSSGSKDEGKDAGKSKKSTDAGAGSSEGGTAAPETTKKGTTASSGATSSAAGE